MKKRLKDILKKVDVLKIVGKNTSKLIEKICMYMIFVAKKGKTTDGHEFITDAIQNGLIL